MVGLANGMNNTPTINTLTHNTLSLFLLPTPTPHPYLQSDEEEPVCQKPIIEEHCEKHHCESAVEKYKACQERVTAKGSGSCEGYAFDLWHCIDHCVSRTLLFIAVNCWVVIFFFNKKKYFCVSPLTLLPFFVVVNACLHICSHLFSLSQQHHIFLPGTITNFYQPEVDFKLWCREANRKSLSLFLLV